jgi:hypothetical protein
MISSPRNSVGKLSRRDHQAGAVQRGEHQGVVRRLGEIVAGDQQHRHGERQQHRLGQRGGGADREVVQERRALETGRIQPERGDGRSRHEQDRQAEAVARAAAPDLEAQDREHPQQQQVLGEHRGEDQLPVHGAASGRRVPSTRCW